MISRMPSEMQGLISMPKPLCETCQQPYSERQTRKHKDGSFWAYRHVGRLGGVTWCHGKKNFADVREKEKQTK